MSDNGWEPGLIDRVRYRFDALMSRGTPAMFGLLGVASLILILAFSAVVLLADLAPKVHGERPGIFRQLFLSLQHGMDTGTISGDNGKWPFLVLMLILTLAGLFVITALIGVVATGLDGKLSELRKGRSRVVERDHTLILGWSETVFTIVAQLAEANQSRRDAAVVILADRDKVEMEDSIREKVGETGPTRIVCRSGSPIDLADLGLVSPQTSRAIIVLAPAGDDPDSHVIKAVLAITRGPERRSDPYHIVAEIHDPSNMEAARLVGGEETVLIDKRETVARLIVQTSRQSGASVVYTELLDFAGDEIYMRSDPDLTGRTYGDALLAYEEACVIGLMSSSGEVKLNPPARTQIAAGDELIAMAEDDERLSAAQPCTERPDRSAFREAPARADAPSRVLVLGWNLRTPLAVRELDEYLAPGSSVTLISDAPEMEGAVSALASLENLELEARAGNTSDRSTLEALAADGCENVIVMCYAEVLDPQRADARTLVTLLHLRDIAERSGWPFSIVSEMLDDRNRELAQVTQVDDVIVSDHVLSLMLSQLAENRHLREVFAELFSSAGSELYLRPASDYVAAGAEISFATLVAAAAERGESAVGYRSSTLAADAERAYGVRVNPPKSWRLTPGDGDKLCVLAEG